MVSSPSVASSQFVVVVSRTGHAVVGWGWGREVTYKCTCASISRWKTLSPLVFYGFMPVVIFFFFKMAFLGKFVAFKHGI